jgi:hypothetical protein
MKRINVDPSCHPDADADPDPGLIPDSESAGKISTGSAILLKWLQYRRLEFRDRFQTRYVSGKGKAQQYRT